MSRAFVFPGQGSQSIGMGRALAMASATARSVFDEVDDALGEKLSQLMFEGDGDRLTLTENAQPALMAVSIAALKVLEERAGQRLAEMASCVAGHSLGEYSALAAAGSISIADAARLLRRRGLAMQAAVPVGIGAMAALLNVDLEKAEEIVADAAQGEVCAVANDNAHGQVVISGHKSAVNRALAIAAEQGARRSVILPVSAPFHCPLMQPAAEAMQEALMQVAIQPPPVPLVANVLAMAVTDPHVIRALLVEQITGDVRWRESVLTMKGMGVTELVEIGAGKVLSGLTRRIDRSLSAFSVHTPEEIDAYLAERGPQAR
ncbi:MAG: ACP S-malonyltransferase [Rhodospirillaceae bacterium]|nr:ACP S-malonyltransferase [Rhodospirillaceae bacterium]